MLLSLTRDIDGHSGFFQISPHDILYFSHDDGHVVFHLQHEEYLAMGSLKYFCAALNASGFRFQKVDRNTVVNMDKVMLVNQKRGMLYFEHVIEAKSKNCPVAFMNYKQIIKQIKLINPELIIQ
ncbi:LytTR family DNA-binding domain-containing protein [Paenibacillus sp. SYP-B4298]|uniref:LytTR family DNA-binding domain-containing protein n=1 Tax=Paenibacillus sp. SYP-B4298 TaxID=2996034 RepID=UPI0022DCF328|nr:LytTR family DNA-binding domain-containing protein [Paenibacillus sp. SYP-B4298]